MTNPVLFHVRDYRGATIEDLDIKPALSINPTTNINIALEIAFENEFTYLPVIHEENKRLLGVLNVGLLRDNPNKLNTSFLKPIVKNYMIWFNQKSREFYEKQDIKPVEPVRNRTIMKPRAKKYKVLTPWTPLEQLADFFNNGIYFAIITNDEGNFVYGVATPEDLTKYENSRPRL
ncbi:hypothetical protein CLIB1444_05S08856 [[Candida] jaroonii]|uniref:Uncharacterized protein n=1 Tax=[Candida] jaroonii TaxID=467808 RepID=A0ACA9Y8V5_9ASCO|nr:hypothetical protein CLIB1444_05S08856 [[Candida] jaroonii]